LRILKQFNGSRLINSNLYARLPEQPLDFCLISSPLSAL